jgi:hydroxymethylpyrimidine/phosphomethylpyrimidine kinase
MSPRALTIAGSDSGGGAGIQADLKTFSALGVYGASVITALTAQNTREVRAIHDVPAAFVASQIDAVLDDIGADAVKVGMLGQPEIITTVAEHLHAHPGPPLVVDPVLASTSGVPLLDPQGIERLRRELLPLATVVTPNLLEVAVLLERPAPRSEEEMIDAGRELLALGLRSVVVKGGHLAGANSVDYFLDGSTILPLTAPRLPMRHTHGTGCTFSAAIAAFLARGMALPQAVKEAKEFVTAAIAASDRLRVGQGRGPVHPFHRFW